MRRCASEVDLFNAAFSAELLNSEREKVGDQQPDAVLGSYAAKLAASRKKLKKVPDAPAYTSVSGLPGYFPSTSASSALSALYQRIQASSQEKQNFVPMRWYAK